MIELMVILSFAGLIAGVIACVLGWRGRRVGDELRCPRCEFDVTSHFGQSAAVTCPECSHKIEFASDARRGTRCHRRGLLTVGATLVICCAPLALIALAQNNATTWLQQRKPTKLLLWEWEHAAPRWPQTAFFELLQRERKGKLTQADLLLMGDALWKRVSAGTILTDTNETSLFSDLVETGLIPRDEFVKRQLASYDWRLETPAAIRAGASIPFTIVDGPLIESQRLRQWAFCGLLLKSEVQITLQDAQGRTVHESRLVPSDFGPYCGVPMRRALPPVATDLAPGEYRLTAELSVRYYGPWERVQAVVSNQQIPVDPTLLEPGPSVKTIAIDQLVNVVDQARPLITLDTSEMRNKAMRDMMNTMRATLSPLMPGHKPRILLSVDPRTLPKGIESVYAVRVEQGDRVAEIPEGGKVQVPELSAWKIVSSATVARSTIILPYAEAFEPGVIRVTLTPAPHIAEQLSGPDAVTNILSEPIVIETQLQASEK
jgi:hypothetical protein